MAPSESTVRASRNRLINDRDAVLTDVVGDGFTMAEIEGARVDPDPGPARETLDEAGVILSGAVPNRAPDRFED